MSARVVSFVVNLHRHLNACRFLATLLLVALGTSAFAQSDPPSRVGRVSEIQGSVFLAPEDTDTSWQPIGINYPVTTGDSVWVGQDGRAEIDFGAGQIRLSNEANVHFSQLDDRQFSAYLAGGRAILRLRMLDPGETAKLDTANAQIDVLRPGSYRIETTADGMVTRIVVRDGEAQLRVGDRALTVLTGQTAVIEGNGYSAALAVRDGYGTDGFDAWSQDRDRRWEGSGLSSRYVSTYVPGVKELDEFGAWESTPTYGAVWYPRAVAVDWVPYRDGSWTFVRPWGWTWVDNARWGWAPFHYGRWVREGHRWGWCPGTFVARPVYAPALVAWYGGAAGTSWAVDFNAGPTFGWVPLAWGEPYWPHYRHSTDYWRVVNRPYAVNVTRVPAKPLPAFSYANARIPGALTAVSGDVFAGRRQIGGNHYVVPTNALSGASITTNPLAVRPMQKPMAIDNLPRGIPAPASALAGRMNTLRPDNRGPGVIDGGPLPGRPGAVAGTISEPNTGSGRPGANPPAFSGRTNVIEPATAQPPTVGRPSGTEPGAGALRPAIRDPGGVARDPRPIRDPGVIANDPRQSGGQSFSPSARPIPGRSPITEPAPGRPQITEPAPYNNAGRPQVREPARFNPGLNSAPQNFAPAPQSIAPASQSIAPAPQSIAPAPRPIAPAPAPMAPVVRERAPAPMPYNPALNPAQGYTPPRPAPVVVPQAVPVVVPPGAPAPIPGRPVPANPAAGGRPVEPQIQMLPAPGTGPRSALPASGGRL